MLLRWVEADLLPPRCASRIIPRRCAKILVAAGADLLATNAEGVIPRDYIDDGESSAEAAQLKEILTP